MKRGREGHYLFRRAHHKKRFEKFKHLDFMEERAFSLERNQITGIREELERRNWIKLNGLSSESNRSITLEFFANVFQGKKDKDPYMPYVRLKEVKFDEDAINTLLETPAPLVCGIEDRIEKLAKITSLEDMEKLEDIKKELCGEGVS